MPQFTPTEQRLLNVLTDGMRHRREELMACLIDDMTDRCTLRVHFCNMRKKLRPIGQDIICEFYNGTFYYRQVRLLAHND